MVLIQVRKRDANQVFSILLKNGKFTGLRGNRFRIDENSESTLKKIKDAGIKVEEL